MDTASQKAPSSCDTKRKGGAPERQKNDVAESIAESGFAGAAQQRTRAGTSSRVASSGVLMFVGLVSDQFQRSTWPVLITEKHQAGALAITPARCYSRSGARPVLFFHHPPRRLGLLGAGSVL
jgi:hypothetical protein